jgi:2-phosphosulfolactate phosphatase
MGVRRIGDILGAMNIEVVLLPRDLAVRHVHGRAVVVFDVLRATTTIVTALAAGANAVRVFPSLDAARDAAASCADRMLLAGEQSCLPPHGFDLGNSPGSFTDARCAGRTIFLSTTNGTRAIVAARDAATMYVAALVNARATADALHHAGRDVTLLCAGTGGCIATEDLLGAGSVIDAAESIGAVSLQGDEAEVARLAFHGARADLPSALRRTAGGRNVIAAGLEPDVDFAARLNAIPLVAGVSLDPLRVVRRSPAV